MPATSGKARAAGLSASLAGASSRSPSALSGRPLWLIGAASAWMATLGNAALWRGLQQLSALDGVRGLGFAAGLALAIAALLTLLLGLLAWRATLKPALVVMLLATAAGAHFMLAYGVVIDPTMMVNVLQTDAREAGDLLTLRFVATMLALGVLPALAVWRWPVRYARWPRQLAHNAALSLVALVVLVASTLAIFQPLASTTRNHKHLRYLINPLNSLYALGRAAAAPLRSGPSKLQPIGEDARLGASHAAQKQAPLVVLVLGETARSANFALNGYGRDTTPELAAAGVASFGNAWSCGTSTAASLPCMFAHLPKQEFEDLEGHYEGLLDVLQRAGLAVLWLDNQAGCKGVCDRVATARTADAPDPALCQDGECFDTILLQDLDQRIAALPTERRARGVVVVMHQMGSHGPAYYKRSPSAFKKFLPECASSSLQDCSTEQVVNAYDNTILYTDHFLGSTIRWLKARQDRADTALVYVSDHGESLGENNLYLHGLPYAMAPGVQKRVPWITWLSPGYSARRGVTGACLQGLRDAPLSHDNYFHSVLGLLDVDTRVYRPGLDVYARCLKG